MQRMKRGMFVGGFAVVSLVLLMASTAYACTYFQGTFRATPTVTNPSTLPAGYGTWVEAAGCDTGTEVPAQISSENHVISSRGDPGIPGTAVKVGNTVDLTTGTTGTFTANDCTFNSTYATTDPGYVAPHQVPANVSLPTGVYDVAVQSAGYGTYGDNYGINGGGFPPCMTADRLLTLGKVTVGPLGTITASSGAFAVTPLTTPGRFTIAGTPSQDPMQAAICIQDRASSRLNPEPDPANPGGIIRTPSGADHGNQVPIALI